MTTPQDKPAPRDERRLVKRLIRGDERAFDAFTSIYLPALLRFALSRLDGDRELAQELVQTTMVKVLPRLESFRFESSLFSWLCACCRNEINMHFRSRRRAPDPIGLEELSEGPDAPQLAEEPVAELSLVRADNQEIVHLTLDLIPRHYSRALVWKYFDELSVKEIARRLDLGPKAAESLLTRARKAFLGSYEELSRDPKVRGVERSARPDGVTPLHNRRSQ